MNELGITLAWLAVQITLVLVPASALRKLASRRGPVHGAWVATLSLGLVVALSAAAFVPKATPVATREIAPPVSAPTADIRAPGAVGSRAVFDRTRTAVAGGWTLADLSRGWAWLGRRTSEPAARCRPWGTALAVAALSATCVGLLHLVIGLSAVALCRRRGRVVDDPEMIALLDELRGSMGYRVPVELREVPDLTSPATAGWRRPVLLLPDQWRSWDDSERRAVFAHELAHMIRGDYASGLLARFAVVLNYYHPLVRWMSTQLQLEQELAADAIGARFAGGPARYLVALSRLALRQDGRSPSWPARMFLPARRTLIRRIAMLRDARGPQVYERPWHVAPRVAATLVLLGLTAAVALLRGPVGGAENDRSSVPSSRAAAPRTDVTPIQPLYLRDDMDGIVALRPAATLRRGGLGVLIPLFRDALPEKVLSQVAKDLQIDTTKPGFLKLGVEDIEWVTSNIGLDRGTRPQKDNLHRIAFGALAVRTVNAFDWLAFFRQWGLEFEAIQPGENGCYRVVGRWKEKLKLVLGRNACVYLPDDRTLVLDEETRIRKFAEARARPVPAYLRGSNWERASHGLLAVAIANPNGELAKRYDFGRPDDKAAIALLKGVNWWIFSVDNADTITLHADAACQNPAAGEALIPQIESVLRLGRSELEPLDPKVPPDGPEPRAVRMCKAFFANVRVERNEQSVHMKADQFGTLAEFASLVEASVKETEKRVATEQPKRLKR